MRPVTLSLTLLLGLMGASAHAQAPVPGQPYAIPQGYEGYSPGSLIAYGGYSYVIQDNATMLLAESQDGGEPDDGTTADDSVPVDTTAYQLPPGYEDAEAGTQISYGGNDYTVMSGGVMMMCNPGYSFADSTQYQIPVDCAGASTGSIVSHGGFNYLVGVGVMIKIRLNVGYGTKAILGKQGLGLTGPVTNGPRTHPGNHGRPGAAGPHTRVAHRPVYSGTTGPAWSHTGTVHPTTGHHGLANQGAAHPGWGHTGMTHPQYTHPGRVNQGTVHPNWVNQGTVHPGWGNQGMGHPGSVHSGWGHAGGGHPGSVHSGWGGHTGGHPGGGRPMMGGGHHGRR